MCSVLGYRYITYKSYTMISHLHDKSLIGISQVCNQHHLYLPNSDSAIAINNCFYYGPIRTLPLLTITKALQLEFGVPPSPLNRSPYLAQTTIRRYPYFVCPDSFIAPQHAGLAHHTLSYYYSIP